MGGVVTVLSLTAPNEKYYKFFFVLQNIASRAHTIIRN